MSTESLNITHICKQNVSTVREHRDMKPNLVQTKPVSCSNDVQLLNVAQYDTRE